MRVENKFRIGWDCDGVLAKSEIPVLYRVNSELNTRFTTKDLTGYNAIRRLALETTGNPQLATKIENFWLDSNIVSLSPPNRHTLLVFKICHYLKIEQHVVTTRPPYCRDSTLSWLRQYLPEINWSHCLHVRNSSRETGNAYKRWKLSELGISHFIEDNGDTARYLIEGGHQRLSFVTQPWNQDFTDLDHLRVEPNNIPKLLFQILRSRRTS